MIDRFHSKPRWVGDTPLSALTNQVQATALILPVRGHGQEDQQLTVLLEVSLGSELPKGRVTFRVQTAWLHGSRMILLNPSLGSFHWAPILNVKGVIANHRTQGAGEIQE